MRRVIGKYQSQCFGQCRWQWEARPCPLAAVAQYGRHLGKNRKKPPFSHPMQSPFLNRRVGLADCLGVIPDETFLYIWMFSFFTIPGIEIWKVKRASVKCTFITFSLFRKKFCSFPHLNCYSSSIFVLPPFGPYQFVWCELADSTAFKAQVLSQQEVIVLLLYKRGTVDRSWVILFL